MRTSDEEKFPCPFREPNPESPDRRWLRYRTQYLDSVALPNITQCNDSNKGCRTVHSLFSYRIHIQLWSGHCYPSVRVVLSSARLVLAWGRWLEKWTCNLKVLVNIRSSMVQGKLSQHKPFEAWSSSKKKYFKLQFVTRRKYRMSENDCTHFEHFYWENKQSHMMVELSKFYVWYAQSILWKETSAATVSVHLNTGWTSYEQQRDLRSKFSEMEEDEDTLSE